MCKDQESIQSSTTPDPGYQWESDKLTVWHHRREPRGQPFPSRWPLGTNKQTGITNTIQKKYNLLCLTSNDTCKWVWNIWCLTSTDICTIRKHQYADIWWHVQDFETSVVWHLQWHVHEFEASVVWHLFTIIECKFNDMSQCMIIPTMCYVRPAKPQISLRIRAVWSEPLLVAWVFYDC